MTTVQRKQIDHLVDSILCALPASDMEAHDEEHITIMKETIGVLGDMLTQSILIPQGVKRLGKLADRAIAVDAQEAGEVSG